MHHIANTRWRLASILFQKLIVHAAVFIRLQQVLFVQVIAICAVLVAGRAVGLGDEMKRPAYTPGLCCGCRIAHGNSLSEKSFDRMYKTNKIINHLVNPVNHVSLTSAARRYGDFEKRLT